MTYAIKFCDVHFAVGNQIILSHIDQCIESQKITTLIGPSGAGKTTFLKLCNGLLSPTTGYIKVGQQMTESLDPTTLRRMVGIVLQQAPILRTTVYDNLALPHKLQSETLAEQEAVQMLEQVGLDASLLYKQATVLSGGQKQKLSIARTLLNDSDVLLLDEITASLDPHSVEEIEQLIFALQQRGKTIIWITHSIEQARKLGQQTIFLKKGRVLASGATEDVWANENEEIQAFLQKVMS